MTPVLLGTVNIIASIDDGGVIVDVEPSPGLTYLETVGILSQAMATVQHPSLFDYEDEDEDEDEDE